DSSGNTIHDSTDLPRSVVRAGEEKIFHYSVKGLHPLLWTPQHPNLYNFKFSLQDGHRLTDEISILSGFRTFEAKDGYLWLNGQRYWLRGGNQTPFALAPNDKTLADRFYDVMKEGNIEVTRTHTTPYNELWIDEADKKGIGISFEGTLPWLFLATSMPDSSLVSIWADEFLSLLKKYRNHPSILFWTVNNEMKFYDNDPDLQRAKTKMTIISDVVRKMRAIDPTRPMVFDSNYKRKGKDKRFGDAFIGGIDDGDIDDIHMYPNWYDYTLFRFFNGAFEQDNRTEGRPLISQEMSTGYPDAETGHATRFYTQVHQTAQALVGNWAYEYSDPAVFLGSHAFITSELAEALRRTGDHTSGILHFSLATWFRNVYDAEAIQPYPVYDAMKRALQPVLVSAELWGRHFYMGRKLPVRVCVVNDQEDGDALPASQLGWSVVDQQGHTLTSGTIAIPGVPHGGRQWVEPGIDLPQANSTGRIDAKLLLTLKTAGAILSTNEYKILLASP
ncbi:MAG: glycoside hydrolase family 2 TIM barrel-domain containing protein, partial [Chitinophaga rupis]